MRSTLRLLLVEDDHDDARLLERCLIRGGYDPDISLIKSDRRLREVLGETQFDLAITDHELPGFDSADVLSALAELAPGLPCILVSGKVGEEVVGQAMRQGTVDYVAKDNLGRLPAVVERALVERDRRHEREAADAAAARSGRLFEAVFANARDALLIVDDGRLVVDANPTAAEMFAVPQAELVGARLDQLVPDPYRGQLSRNWAGSLRIEQLSGEIDVLRADGALIETEYTAVFNFMPKRHIIFVRDVREQRSAEEEVKRRITQQEAIAELGELALREQNLDRVIDFATQTVAGTLDVTGASILELEKGGKSFVVRAESGTGPPRIGAQIPHQPEVRSLESFTMRQHEAVLVTDYAEETRFNRTPTLEKLGICSALAVSVPGRETPYGILATGSTSPNAFSSEDANFLTAVAHLVADAIERARGEAEIRERALHDPLTGLPNRTLFFDRLTSGLARGRRVGSPLAVLIVDIDGFNGYNDALGHRAADRLLSRVGARIAGIMREVDTVARFAGDEFAILCENLVDKAEAEALADRLLAAFEAPFSFEAELHRVSLSVGIALSDAGSDGEELVRDADIAMYRSKDAGRARWTVATERMRADVLERSNTKRDIERAIENGELCLHYQPIVALDGGKLTAVEALIRWEHPERGMISPGQFVPLAEESGLILRLGEWVLRAACSQAALWRAEFGDAAPLPIHVNIAARQVAQIKLPDLVSAVLEETGTSPQDIALELTETSLIENLGSPRETLARLRAMGVDVVIDDFGTGYSSLSYLERFAFDTLKIDQSFVSPLGEPDAPIAIVMAIVGMARALGIDAVAEGVETAEQTAVVTALGCKYAQGYFFARPGPAEQIAALIRDDTPLRERAAEASALAATSLDGGASAEGLALTGPLGPAIAGYRQSFLTSLLSGDSHGAEEVVGAALADRIDIEVIDARIIAAAMIEIGRLWETGAISVADEHVATGIANRAAALVVSAVARRLGFRPGPAQSRTALLATVEGEQHGLGLRMVADMLHLHGVETRFLGTNVPGRELCAFASLMQPDTIALSLSLTARAPALVEQVDALRCVSPKAAFLIGGQGASTALADRVGASYMRDVEVLVGEFRSAGRQRTEVFEAAPTGHVVAGR